MEKLENKFSCITCGKSFKKETTLSKHKCIKKPEVSQCVYCGKIYKNEKSFIKHSCNIKKRYLAKDNKAERQAYGMYIKIIVNNNKKSQNNKSSDKILDTFIRSSLYGAFVKFSKHCIDNKIGDPYDFISYLQKLNIGIDFWTTERNLQNYYRHRIINEPYDKAIERSLKIVENWTKEKNLDISEFYQRVSTAEFVYMVEKQHISPWFIFTCPTAEIVWSKLTHEQEQILEKHINPSYWKPRIEKESKNLEHFKIVFDEVGL